MVNKRTIDRITEIIVAILKAHEPHIENGQPVGLVTARHYRKIAEEIALNALAEVYKEEQCNKQS